MRRQCLLLVPALLLMLSPGLLEAQSRGSSKSATQLEADLRRVRNKQSKLRRDLQRTKRQAMQVMGDIRSVDTHLVEVQNSLESTAWRLKKSREEQKQVAEELQIATKKLDRSRDQVRTRLKRIYMRGPASTISAFVGTSSAGELASRGYLLQAIAKKDRQVFDEYRRLRKIVADKKQRADALVTEIEELLSRQRRWEGDLKVARQEKGEYLDELKQKEGKLQDLIKQLEDDENRIEAQIVAFSRSKRGSSLPPFIGSFTRPVSSRMGSGFGMRYHPILRIRRMHKGVDFPAPSGTPIKAAADGEVIAAQYMSGYGNTVIIEHGSNISTVYAHCSRISVKVGQKVTRGQQIGKVGQTGLATGPHLHWEVRVNGRAVDPRSKL